MCSLLFFGWLRHQYSGCCTGAHRLQSSWCVCHSHLAIWWIECSGWHNDESCTVCLDSPWLGSRICSPTLRHLGASYIDLGFHSVINIFVIKEMPGCSHDGFCFLDSCSNSSIFISERCDDCMLGFLASNMPKLWQVGLICFSLFRRRLANS